MVNIRGTFANDDREFNGLEAEAEAFILHPLDRKVVVGVVETSKVVQDITNGGITTPTVRFVQLEVLGGPDAEQAKAMLDRRFRNRTGRDDAPQDSLFDAAGGDADVPWPGDVDYDTPENAEAS